MKYKVKDDKLIIEIDDEFSNKTLSDFLDYYRQSRKNKYLLIKDKKIRVNSLLVNLDYMFKLNDILEIVIDEEEIDYEIEKKEIDIVYEDDIVLVVNKPKDLIVHDVCNSLANRVAYYYSLSGYRKSIRHLHRLDKETQGLLMYCKVSFLLPYFDYLISSKKIKRYYKAIVFNKLDKDKIIDKPIGKDRHVNNKYRVSSSGLKSITYIKRLAFKNKYSLIECVLETGRTHQIRVHLSSENLFIVNDSIYGKKSDDFKNMGLYAYCLKWNNPFTHIKHTVSLKDNEDIGYFKMK